DASTAALAQQDGAEACRAPASTSSPTREAILGTNAPRKYPVARWPGGGGELPVMRRDDHR
ncbi:MAG: hypothetical protein J2P57_24365, partial [Acidimicrobiaceae bacterium]|nr:hypothetical protein [Acidimicrobiaceae bacterium]